MSSKAALSALALAFLIAPASPSQAFTGAGCPDLPEYYRAVGTIENGAYSCGMSMEEAKRILARGNPDAPSQPAPPPAHPHRKHHRRIAPQM